MNWADTNPWKGNPTLRQEASWGAYQFGRNQFASSFARNGFARTAFSLTPGGAFRSGMSRTSKFGSAKHISNLERMVASNPSNPNYQDALTKARGGVNSRASSFLSKAGKVGMGAGFVALPFFTTPGGVGEKLRASTAGAAGSYIGWKAGSKLGMSTGGAIGAVLIPVPGVGSAIGAAAGWVVGAFGGAMIGEEVADSLSRIPDRLVERERNSRNLNWRNDQSAFLTNNAYTMRQQSLAAMNRGMNNARSLMGREGMFLHS